MKFLLSCLLLLAFLGGVVLLGERTRLEQALAQERTLRARAEAATSELEERLSTARLEMTRLAADIQARLDSGKARERFLAELEQRLGRPGAPASRPGPTPEERAHALAMSSLTRSLNRLLADSGYGRVRFFAIEGLEGKALVNVALHHLGPDGLVGHALRAERLFLTLDPAARELKLSSPKGRELVDGEWVDFGLEGWELRLPEVDPTPWRHFALAPVEVLPEPPPLPSVPRPHLEMAERKEWLARFATLLHGEAGLTGHRYRVGSLESLSVDGFCGVTLLGYTFRGLLAERFQAERMRAEAPAEGQGVRLLLEEGFHEDEKGRRPLPPSGYLLYLPGADRSAWSRLLGVRLAGAPPENP